MFNPIDKVFTQNIDRANFRLTSYYADGGPAFITTAPVSPVEICVTVNVTLVTPLNPSTVDVADNVPLSIPVVWLNDKPLLTTKPVSPVQV